MPVVVFDCPHCGAHRMTFDFAGDYPVRPPDPPLRSLNVSRPHPGIWNTFFVCRGCRNAVVIKVYGSRDAFGRAPHDCSTDLFSEGFEPIELYPGPRKLEALEHVPEQLAANYREATRNLNRHEYTSAVMMLRRILDRATVDLAPKDRKAQSRKMRLSDRIKQLPMDKALTPAMREWADVICLVGGDPEHNKDADEASATELHQFTELFLIYAFTLPGRVVAYRKEAQAKP